MTHYERVHILKMQNAYQEVKNKLAYEEREFRWLEEIKQEQFIRSLVEA